MKKQNNILSNKFRQYTSAGAAFLLTTPISNAAVISTSINPDQTFGVGQSLNTYLNGDEINDVCNQPSSFYKMSISLCKSPFFHTVSDFSCQKITYYCRNNLVVNN